LVAAAAPLPSAWAGPEWHAGIQPALAVDFERDAPRWAFDGSLDADLLFGRERAGTFGYGPALEVGTWAFSDVRVAPLGRIVVPIGDLDLGCSLGPRVRVFDGTELGVVGRAFLGYRAFNYSGPYGAGFGLYGGIDRGLHNARTTWTLGLHIDAMWASLPFVVLASWVRGSPDD
jgi:hypothetical protein